jgi:hypothetical protein
VVNQQLQQPRELDRDLCMTNSSLDPRVTVNPNRVKAADGVKGRQFVAALKAKYDGKRPIIEDVIFATVELADLQAGKSYLEISHHPHHGSHKPYYETKITNKSPKEFGSIDLELTFKRVKL